MKNCAMQDIGSPTILVKTSQTIKAVLTKDITSPATSSTIQLYSAELESAACPLTQTYMSVSYTKKGRD